MAGEVVAACDCVEEREGFVDSDDEDVVGRDCVVVVFGRVDALLVVVVVVD